MPQGFDQPTSSSVSPITNTGLCEQTSQQPNIRTRQGRFEAPSMLPGAEGAKPPYQTTSRCKSSNPSGLSFPQLSSESQSPPSGRKSPAYLQGRSPYGRVLDRTQHPYRGPKEVPTAAALPFQAGLGIDARPSVFVAADFQTHSLAREPELSNTQTRPLPSRQSHVPKSVCSAKDFFEKEAFQRPSAAHLPPLVPGTSTTRKLASKAHPASSSCEPPARDPSPQAFASNEQAPGTGLLLSALTDFYDTSESVQSVIPYKQGESDECAPIVTKWKATPPAESSDQGEEQYWYDIERESTSRGRSTNVSAEIPDGAKPSGLGSLAESNSSARDDITSASRPVTGEIMLVDHMGTCDEIVRRLSTRNSIPAAETREAKNSDPPKQQGRRARSGRELRKTFKEDSGTSPKRLRRSGSHTAALSESGSSPKEHLDRVAEWTPSADAAVCQNRFGKSIGVRRRAQEIVSRELGHDGASDPSLSPQSTISSPIPTANIGVEAGYSDFKVPHDIDNRQGYGRRVTQDFGFPGARIKSHGTPRTSKPLPDPGNWTKRACGHFSYMGKSEDREQAQQKLCRQCSTQAPVFEKLMSAKRRTRRQASSEPSSSKMSSKFSKDSGSCRRRRYRHSECMSYDTCQDNFAEELVYIIDNILEEHANTLQNVISNIQNSQPSLNQLRRASGDLAQRCQTHGCLSKPLQTSCRLAQPTRQRDDDWHPPCPYIPPKAAQRLNVGSTGQLKPNLNDPTSTLREEIRSIPDLIDLVESAADDLGLDLERRPTATNDDMFNNAPYETTHRDAVSHHPDISFETIEGKITEDKPLTEDSWLKQTRRHLTELSETREQLMNELDSIAGELDVQLQDWPETESMNKSDVPPAQSLLSKAPTDLYFTSTLQNDALVDSVQRVFSTIPVGSFHESTQHEGAPVNSNTDQDHRAYYEGKPSSKPMEPMLSETSTSVSRSSTWQGNNPVEIEDLEADVTDVHEDDPSSTTVQRFLSKTPLLVLSKPAWPSSKAISSADDELHSILDNSVDELGLNHTINRILNQPTESPYAIQEPSKAEDGSREEI
jgi:hypothetical protein